MCFQMRRSIDKSKVFLKQLLLLLYNEWYYFHFLCSKVDFII